MLKLEEVSKIYSKKTKQQKLALSDVAFEIKTNDILAIVGPNGSGKSTLSYIISTLTKKTTGQLFFNELNYDKKSSVKKMRKNIGYCFQFPDLQLLKFSIEDEVAFTLKNFKDKDWREKTEQTLKDFGLFDIKNISPFKTSMGQKRKINIASIINSTPNLIILDEPTANLDVESRDTIINILKQTTLSKNNIVIIISHDIDFLWEVSNKTLLLNDGKVKKFGNSNEVLTDEILLKENNLELPNIIKVCSKLKLDCKDIKNINNFFEKYGNKI